MPRNTIQLFGPTSRSRFAEINNQQTYNLINVGGDGSKEPVVLESAPGLRFAAAAGDGACRSPELISWRHPVDETTDLYGVFGSRLARIRTDFTTEEIGTLSTSSGLCRIARGRTHIMVVDGSYGYTYDGTTFAQIADADFPDADATEPGAPTHVSYLDTYFIVIDALTDNFYISAVEDPDSWNALDFEAAASSPDRALALAATESSLWIFGDESSQAYYNSGNADFPFSINLSATKQVGIAAPQSIARDRNGIYFVATMGSSGGVFVYRIRGLEGEVVSTDEIATELSSVSLDNAYGFLYTQGQRSFYVLQYADDRPTLVYNITAGLWESRGMGQSSAWRAAGHGVLGSANVVGSRLAGQVFELSYDTFADSTSPLIRRRRTSVQHTATDDLDWHELTIDGTFGATPDPAATPTIRMRYSDDGGFVWSDWLTESLGTQGQRTLKARWSRLGSAEQRIFEIESDYPGPFALVGGYVRVEVLAD